MKVIMMMAQSADGVIARHNQHYPDWTCSADKKLFKQVTQNAGALIMGSRTYKTIGKPLPGRLNIVYTRRPEQFEPRDNLMLTAMEPKALVEMLSKKGYRKVILTGGAAINSLFAKDDLIHEILLTISPILFGRGLSIFEHPVEKRLALLANRLLDADTMLLHYKVL